MGHEASGPIVERGFVRGATLTADTELDDSRPRLDSVRSRFVVVADGANSSFGRALGTTRHHNWPYGIATRTYFAQRSQLRVVDRIDARTSRRRGESHRRIRMGDPARRRDAQRRRGRAVDLPRRTRSERVEAARCLRSSHRRALGDRPVGETQGTDPVPDPARRVRRPEDGADVPRGRRRRRCGQPLQRRWRRCRPHERSPGRRGARRGAHHRQLDHPAAVPDDPQRRRRPVPQGRPA